MVPFHNLAQPTIFTNWCVSKHFSFPLPHQHFPNNQRIATLPAFSIGTIQATTRIIDGSFEISCQVLRKKVWIFQGVLTKVGIISGSMGIFGRPVAHGGWNARTTEAGKQKWLYQTAKKENDACCMMNLWDNLFLKHAPYKWYPKKSKKLGQLPWFRGFNSRCTTWETRQKSIPNHPSFGNTFINTNSVCNRNPSLCKRYTLNIPKLSHLKTPPLSKLIQLPAPFKSHPTCLGAKVLGKTPRECPEVTNRSWWFAWRNFRATWIRIPKPSGPKSK